MSKKAAFGVDVPIEGYPALVKGMPGTGYGVLCQFSFTFRPTAVTIFNGLYFKVGRSTKPVYTPDEVVAAPLYGFSKNDLFGSASATTTVSRTYNEALIADCGPNGAEKPGTLFLVESGLNFNNGVWEPFVNPVDVRRFKGRCCLSCTERLEGEQEELNLQERPERGARLRSLASTVDFDAHPTDSNGEWLLYSGLSVNRGVAGNRLMRNGLPLRARLIAVAATNVNWTYTPFRGSLRHIRRPLGDLVFSRFDAFSPLFFPSAPQNCIALWQNNLSLQEFVVSSECHQHPNLVHLDSSEDIFSQVNYDLTAQDPPRSGTYDLWVKVID